MGNDCDILDENKTVRLEAVKITADLDPQWFDDKGSFNSGAFIETAKTIEKYINSKTVAIRGRKKASKK